VAARDARQGRQLPAQPGASNLPTFEEFYATVNGGKKPSGMRYEAMRAFTDPAGRNVPHRADATERRPKKPSP